MGLRVRTNMASINATRNLEKATADMGKDIEKLSSGHRINRASDDAAGLAISEKMRGNIRSLGQAKRNASDGISMVQTAEGSMNEISNILIRLREISTQSASDTIGNTERTFINREYVQLVNEIDRISKSTDFQGRSLLQGSESMGIEEFTIHVGAGDGQVANTDTIGINMDTIRIDAAETLGLGKENEVGPTEMGGDFNRATAAAKLTTIDTALKTISSNRAFLGATQSRLGSTINNLGIQIENMQSANSRIRDVDFASATASYTQNRILQSGGVSVLSQANAAPELALSLLR